MVEIERKKMKKIDRCKKEVEREIAWYKVHETLADSMRKLAAMGFEFCGHGVELASLGVPVAEDFSLIKLYSKRISIHISLSRKWNTTRNLKPHITIQMEDDAREVTNLDVKKTTFENLIPTIKQIEKSLATLTPLLK